jgi:ubiquinone/menaquinone biosynthesis C-methylase UbiE
VSNRNSFADFNSVVLHGFAALTSAPPMKKGAHDIKSYSSRLQGKAKAERYAKRFEQGSRKRIDQREQRAVRKIFAGLKDCRSVLDVPSGAGRFLGTLAQGGRRVIEIDVAFEILEFVLEKASKSKANACAAQGDASRLPLADGAVDCVFSNRLLHHIHAPAERQAILREFHRVCRRWTVVSFFNYKGLAGVRGLLKKLKGRTPPYEKQPTLEQFTAEAAQAGFTVQAIVPTGLPWVSQKYFVLEKA